ncbi:hypothetical protein DBR32_00065 [Taibaiella sp. KBW10]|uniref:hypothetical protein n=1 Tax=Taibaiella sp. KBW10 TaxID=2153357 RepID=UPI000F59AB16|nr:hypothetical protein [Taibaiella sp. KBW10]RQO32050.1 hypothetical protein DBR32_00065 [Taibaiella sp. KBW10]
MNQRDVNFVSICRTLRRVLSTYQPVWSTMSAFSDQAEQFEQLIDALSIATERTEVVTTGTTGQKAETELKAIRLAVNLAKRASVYALQQHNLELHEQLRISKSSLLNRPDNLTLARLRDIHSRLLPLASQLSEYAVLPADITLLDSLNNDFERLISTLRAAIVNRKGYNQDRIPELLADTRLCLYKMDSLVNVFAGTARV